MSGKLKEVRTRIASVKSTQQITKAMKLVSAAKLRRAQDAIVQMRPYADKMSNILRNISAASEGEAEIAYAKEREAKKVLIVAITSDKGLCGGFNANVIKQVKRTIEEKYAAQRDAGNVEMLCVGKKGNDFFQTFDLPLNSDFVGLFGKTVEFENVAEAAEFIKAGFVNGDYDVVEVVYNRFKNAATQVLSSEQYLPIKQMETEETDSEKSFSVDYIFEPDQAQLIGELVPKILNLQFFKFVLDSNAAEHGARMTAMDQATENANELLRDLRISYNRARQAAITTELTEIVSGAAALGG